MRLDNFYSIETDQYNVILRYYKEGELNDKGNPIISKSESYFATVEQALQVYLNKCIKEAITPNSDVDAILSEIWAANKNISMILQSQKEEA